MLDTRVARMLRAMAISKEEEEEVHMTKDSVVLVPGMVVLKKLLGSY